MTTSRVLLCTTLLISNSVAYGASRQTDPSASSNSTANTPAANSTTATATPAVLATARTIHLIPAAVSVLAVCSDTLPFYWRVAAPFLTYIASDRLPDFVHDTFSLTTKADNSFVNLADRSQRFGKAMWNTDITKSAQTTYNKTSQMISNIKKSSIAKNMTVIAGTLVGVYALSKNISWGLAKNVGIGFGILYGIDKLTEYFDRKPGFIAPVSSAAVSAAPATTSTASTPPTASQAPLATRPSAQTTTISSRNAAASTTPKTNHKSSVFVDEDDGN